MRLRWRVDRCDLDRGGADWESVHAVLGPQRWRKRSKVDRLDS